MGKKRKKKTKRQQKQSFSTPTDLIIAIDWSKRKKTMFGLVGARKDRLPTISKRGSWLKHISDTKNKQERKAYVSKFPHRLQDIKPNLNIIQADFDWQRIKRTLEEKRPMQTIIDDAIYYKYNFQNRPGTILESKAKRHHELRTLVLLADNIAYIAREEYERLKNYEELKRRLRKLGIL